MSSNNFWFKHDYNARNDPKMQNVLMEMGMSGIGLYWCIIEMLHEENGYLLLGKCKSYAFALHIDVSLIIRLINEFDLFEKDETRFWSKRALSSLNAINEKRAKAQASAFKKWEKHENANALQMQSNNNANALQMQSNRNADKIREDKIREEISKSHSAAVAPAQPIEDINGHDINSHKPKKEAMSRVSVNTKASASFTKEVSRKQPEVLYWKALVNVWLVFYEQHFKNEENGAPAKPDFDKVQGNFLKKIIIKLERLAKHSEHEWSEKVAIRYLNRFLNKAWDKGQWMQEHFELKNLLSEFNSIINSNGNNDQAAVNTATKGANGYKPPTGADLVTARLKQNLQLYATRTGGDFESEI